MQRGPAGIEGASIAVADRISTNGIKQVVEARAALLGVECDVSDRVKLIATLYADCAPIQTAHPGQRRRNHCAR